MDNDQPVKIGMPVEMVTRKIRNDHAGRTQTVMQFRKVKE
jgi:uncharacterized OB-fold protein